MFQESFITRFCLTRGFISEGLLYLHLPHSLSLHDDPIGADAQLFVIIKGPTHNFQGSSRKPFFFLFIQKMISANRHFEIKGGHLYFKIMKILTRSRQESSCFRLQITKFVLTAGITSKSRHCELSVKVFDCFVTQTLS